MQAAKLLLDDVIITDKVNFRYLSTVYRVLNACVKRMRDYEFLPHAQSFYAH